FITNVKISQYSQDFLIKAAAKKRISVEELASEILSDAARSWGGSAVLGVPPMSNCRGFPHERLHQDNEAIQNKLSEIVTIGEVKKEYSSNPLANKQPYAYYADPEEPAIPIEDWDIENSYGEVL
ncbi:MAG: hypothetical protein F6K57_38155, partial [Moorea sp. SIO4A5]|nr:hypothetical protein [Moorena sp. SIO4A5]